MWFLKFKELKSRTFDVIDELIDNNNGISDGIELHAEEEQKAP